MRLRNKFLGILRSAKLLVMLAIFIAGLIALVLISERDEVRTVNGIAHIVDGDSIRIDGKNIRLVGIDAPELKQQCLLNGNNWSCGDAAKDALVDKVGENRVACVSEGRDKYRRHLAKCTVEDEDLSHWMVISGWAVSYGDYELAEAYAKQREIGIWQSEFELPENWRKHAGVSEPGFDLLGFIQNLESW